jgi:hypothetical protein
MRVLGISPLDKDATAAIVEDGRVLFAAAEERFSRRKQHDGFPHAAVRAAFAYTGLGPQDIDVVAYPFLDWRVEAEHMRRCVGANSDGPHRAQPVAAQRALLAEAVRRLPARSRAVPARPTRPADAQGAAKEHVLPPGGVRSAPRTAGRSLVCSAVNRAGAAATDAGRRSRRCAHRAQPGDEVAAPRAPLLTPPTPTMRAGSTMR